MLYDILVWLSFEEHFFIPYDHYASQYNQKDSLDDFTIGMRSKQLVEKPRCDMEDDSDKDISVCLVIEPVHKYNKRENANQKIQAVDKAVIHNIALIVITNSG